MNIDRTTIVVRERKLPELYDLALLVIRRHFWALGLLLLIGCGPFVLLNWWLLRGHGEDAWWTWYPCLLLIAVEGPFATAPIAAYLGTALFDEHPRLGAALRMALVRWRALLLFGLYRGLLALIPLLLVLYPPHTAEVCVLERQPLGATWRRLASLRTVWSNEWTLHLLLGGPLMALGVIFLIEAVQVITSLLLHADLMNEESSLTPYIPGASFAPHLAIWLVMGYLAVVRFLSYIDLRTRREGWEIDLALRRAAQRLEPSA
ncbi:MAG: hypothetical protein H0W78_09235 [Planctomycetes bacterium]|jgi:hypothetical protein|nr:hypothetical protein [Planctomycetota bacterium]